MRRFVFCMVVAGMVGSATAAMAQEPEQGVRYSGIGMRAGFSLSPDQFVVGGQVDLGYLFKNAKLLGVAEVGFGDNVTVWSFAGDLLYRGNGVWEKWTPYGGAEAGLILASSSGNTNSDFAISLVAGVDKSIGNGNRFGVEFRIGVVDAPDFKASAVWTFGN
jgi:hypothetical protein